MEQATTRRNTAAASAQEAHEAIRPAVVEGRFRTPKGTGILDNKKKLDLYQLIYDRTLASVMKDAKIERKVGPGREEKKGVSMVVTSPHMPLSFCMGRG